MSETLQNALYIGLIAGNAISAVCSAWIAVSATRRADRAEYDRNRFDSSKTVVAPAWHAPRGRR